MIIAKFYFYNPFEIHIGANCNNNNKMPFEIRLFFFFHSFFPPYHKIVFALNDHVTATEWTKNWLKHGNSYWFIFIELIVSFQPNELL